MKTQPTSIRPVQPARAEALINPITSFDTHGEVLTSLAANGGHFDKTANLAVFLEELTHWAIFASALVLQALLVDILWLG